MKLCGCLESCFVNGEKVWDRLGQIICFYAGEEDRNGECIATCLKTNEQVVPYINEEQYQIVKNGENKCNK